MSIKKKILIGIISIILVVSIVGGVAVAIKRANAQDVMVIPLSSLSTGYFGDNYGEGDVTGDIVRNVTQKIQLQSDSIVQEVYVEKGDKVKEGDKLMSYDTTLTQMELEIEKLTRENNEQKLTRAKNRLASLKNGGAIDEDYDSGEDSNVREPDDEDEPNEDEAAAPSAYVRTAAHGGVKAMALSMSGQISATANEDEQETPTVTPTDTPTETPMATPEETVTSTPTPTPTPEETGKPGIAQSDEPYVILDYDSEPYAGTGTPQDPYRFLCSSREEYVTVMGTFLNKMAGYDAEGKKKVDAEAPYWYQLEFHENDTVSDIENPDKSLLGSYIRKGAGKSSDPMDEKHFSVDGAMEVPDNETVLTPTPTPEEEEPEEPEDIDSGEETSSITREEAIASAEANIKSLELEIQENDIQIRKLEKTLENETVVAAIDGTVKVVGDPLTGESDGDAFIQVKSNDGLYVQGTISEMLLDKIQAGDVLEGQNYDTGEAFSAQIKEISMFPSSSQSGSYIFYDGSSNPNVSYYPVIAVVQGDMNFSEGSGVALNISDTAQDSGNGIYIEAAFVRTENGQSYMYIDDGGVLKKQIVTAEKSKDGYSMEVTSGLTGDELVAFPYGKGVKEGAKTSEGSLDQLYDY